jgi:hypothetical protein
MSLYCFPLLARHSTHFCFPDPYLRPAAHYQDFVACLLEPIVCSPNLLPIARTRCPKLPTAFFCCPRFSRISQVLYAHCPVTYIAAQQRLWTVGALSGLLDYFLSTALVSIHCPGFSPLQPVIHQVALG